MTREERIREIGREIFSAMGGPSRPFWRFEVWKDFLLRAGMAAPYLKEKFLLLLDAYPTQRRLKEIKTYLLELLTDPKVPSWLEWIFKPIPSPLLAPTMRWGMRWLAIRFITGSNLAQAQAKIASIRDGGSDVSVVLLGEGLTSQEEADRHRDTYVGLLSAFPRANVSLKLSALGSNFDPLNRASHDQIKTRLRAILKEATARPDSFVWVDMENHALKDITISLYKQILEEPEFREFSHLGIAIQVYLKETERDLEDLLEWSKARGRKTPIRLVKGAYWDQENIWAAKAGWPVPVFPRKGQTDSSFERFSRFLLENQEHFDPAFGSHNVRSIAAVIASAEELGLPKSAYEFQMLYGMGDPLRRALAAKGYRTRVYCPYGELIPGMAYLVRRVLENTANESFLTLSATGKFSVEELLASPVEAAKKEGEHAQTSPLEGFHNEPLTDWSLVENHSRMTEALGRVRGQFGKRYDPVIDTKTLQAPAAIEIRNVSNRNEILGKVGLADRVLADRALEAAQKAFPGWSQTPVQTRSELMRKAARLIRERRFDLAAWLVFEIGKNWTEADAEAAEAVDFLEYYSRQSVEMFKPKKLVPMTGVKNSLVYEPLGAGVVIAPWNFPLAILMGMTAAALATGNTLIMKPAEQSSIIAAKLMEILSTVLPPGVVNFVPGMGEEIGAYLVENEGTQFVAFTGSTAVGQALRGAIARSRNFNKRIILETGGKNAIFVDRDCDRDQAVKGVLDSAFSYNGQKCSACSRLIVHSDIHDVFLKRLVEMAQTLNMGSPEDPSTQIGPLIDDPGFQKTARYAALAEKEGRIELAPRLDPDKRTASPLIVSGVSPRAALAQEEIFGPVLVVLKARDLEDAICLANAVPFGLTAGIFTRTESHKQRFFREVRAGVLYANRKITHAQVGVVPFGGVGLSGTGIHAGGPDYLREFVNAKVQIDDLLMYEANLQIREQQP